MKSLICVVLSLVSVIAVASATVSNVKARQRYPWNGKVDIDCTLTGETGQFYYLKVSVRDKMGGTNLNVTAVSVDGGSVTNNPVSVTPGVCRLIWDAEKDLPNGFRGEKVSISVTVTTPSKKFMIVDLESGAVAYQSSAPEGGWNVDEYKGTKMAFVRIEPGTFTQYSVTNMPGREVTIAKPYYMGILPVTHKQLRALVGSTYMGQTFDDVTWNFKPTDYTNSGSSQPYRYTISRFGNAAGVYRWTFDDSRLVREDYTLSFQWDYLWPCCGRSVRDSSPLGVLRSRTGLDKFDLPTEAQVVFARDQVIWDGYTMCLDVWNPWLGTTNIVDPQGDVGIQKLENSTSSTYYQSYSASPVCVGCQIYDRTPMSNIGSCSTRFCLFEAE